MFFPERVLLLAAVALATQAALALGYCTTDFKGDLSGTPQQLQDVNLPQPISSWNIQIPHVDNCDKVGVVMTCCDDEAPPVVRVVDLSSAVVERRGPRLVPAVASTTVYCRRQQRPPHGWVSA